MTQPPTSHGDARAKPDTTPDVTCDATPDIAPDTRLKATPGARSGVATDMGPGPELCLAATRFLDCDSEVVRSFAETAATGLGSEVDRAVALYYAVRDGIRYDPYASSGDPASYVASAIARMESAYCVQKAVLYTASARALGIPARLQFADVRNHLSSAKLREQMGTDVFAYHGYSAVYLSGRWVKATPVFNVELCERFGVLPLEFDGRADSVFHAYDRENRRHMEYVRDRGAHADLPFDAMMATLRETYPQWYRHDRPADDAEFATD